MWRTIRLHWVHSLFQEVSLGNRACLQGTISLDGSIPILCGLHLFEVKSMGHCVHALTQNVEISFDTFLCQMLSMYVSAKKFKKYILSTSPSACHWKRNDEDTACLRKPEIQWFLLKLIKHETNIKILNCVSLNLNLSSDIHKPFITNCLYYPREKCSFF